MFDSSSLDKVLDQALSLASVSFEAAFRELQRVSFVTGIKPETMVAAVAGLTTFMLALLVFSGRRGGRPRHRVQTAWPAETSRMSTPPEAPRESTIVVRMPEASRHAVKERFTITDELREQLQRKVWRTPSEPSRTEMPVASDVGSSHQVGEAFSSVMKLAGDAFQSSTTDVTAFIGRTASHVQSGLASISAAPKKSGCSGACYWERVARKGRKDQVLSCLGWYPWQCQHCQTRSYFRCRTS